MVDVVPTSKVGRELQIQNNQRMTTGLFTVMMVTISLPFHKIPKTRLSAKRKNSRKVESGPALPKPPESTGLARTKRREHDRLDESENVMELA